MGICMCINPRPDCPCHKLNAPRDWDNQFIPPIKSGWQCPRCQAVMNPSMPTCFYCKPEKKKKGDR